MTLNFIWLYDSSYGALDGVVTSLLPLLPGPLCPGLVVCIRVLFIGQIDLFKKYLYSAGISFNSKSFALDSVTLHK